MTIEVAKSLELGQTKIRNASKFVGIASYRCQFWFRGSLHCSLSTDGVQWFDYQDLEIG